MSQIAINTSQNVNINFNTASVGERILAFFIDMVIKGAYILVLFYFLTNIFHINRFTRNWDDWSMMAFFVIITLPFHLYTLVCESLMEGQTFGKRIMKIRVVKIDGYEAGFGDYLIRWVFRIVDIMMSSGVVGLVSVIVSDNNQRLGGIASGTAVISLKNNVNISHTILEQISEDYIPVFPQVVSLTDNDVRIIKENFSRAIAKHDRQIISRLSQKISETLNISRDPQIYTEMKFVDKIIKDYNYYTGRDN